MAAIVAVAQAGLLDGGYGSIGSIGGLGSLGGLSGGYGSLGGGLGGISSSSISIGHSAPVLQQVAQPLLVKQVAQPLLVKQIATPVAKQIDYYVSKNKKIIKSKVNFYRGSSKVLNTAFLNMIKIHNISDTVDNLKFFLR